MFQLKVELCINNVNEELYEECYFDISNVIFFG